MKDLFGNEVVPKVEGVKEGRTKSGSYLVNPMLKMYGETKGEICKNCDHLVRKSYSKVYYKCELRGNVDKCSTVSDHKVRWSACGKFVKSIDN